MDDIVWKDVYSKSEETGQKFAHPIKPIRWTLDYEQNLAETLEWLVRSGRSKKIREQKASTINLVRDRWYRFDPREGVFFHICFPQDMLNFRSQYDGLYSDMENLKEFKGAHIRLAQTTGMAWNAYKCVGWDGMDQDERDRQVWKDKCWRCGTPLPNALKAWVVMQVRLKDIN